MKIKIDNDRIKIFCDKYHVKKFSFFGSVIRNDFADTSDIDVLVEFEKGHTPGFFALYDMEIELSGILGKKTDIRTPGDISRFFRDEVIKSAAVQYEA